jgi:predicted kinase
LLIAMAGLPGTGKSTLAAHLAPKLGAVILGKDEVRAALFPPPVRDYSPEQNDIAMRAIYQAATYIRKNFLARAVILDGRTFLRAYQIADLLALAAAMNEVPRIIECICADEVAHRRLKQDLDRGQHPARDRTVDLYQRVKAEAEPIRLPHLVLDTGRLTPAECVGRCLAYLRCENDDGGTND